MPGQGRKTRGASPSASPSKRARKGVRRKQVLASITRAHGETVSDEDLHCGGQAVDTNLDSIMNMLINMSSHLQFTEEAMQQLRAEKAATLTTSPSTMCAD